MKICLIFCIFTDTPGTFPAAIAQITWPPSQTYTLLTMPIKVIYYSNCLQCGREVAVWWISDWRIATPVSLQSLGTAARDLCVREPCAVM